MNRSITIPSSCEPRVHHRHPVTHRSLSSCAGFTIVEAMLAAMVMVFGISTSILVMQAGFKQLATARNVVTAGQVVQSEIEKLRAMPWADVSTLPTAPTAIALDSAYSALPGAGNFQLVRTITAQQPGMLRIDFTITWKNYDGRELSRTATTLYAQYGLYDWFVSV